MITPQLLASVKRGEGCRLKAYPDPESPRAKALALPLAKRPANWQTLSGAPWTIGWGHTGPEVHEGIVWTQEMADEALMQDLEHAQALCDQHVPWWRQMGQPRQDVMAELMFNMGWGDGAHRLSSFHNTLAKMQAHDYAGAADGMLASHWAIQVGSRAKRLADQMRSGIYVK